MKGLRDELGAPDNVDCDPASLSEAERTARGILPVATSLNDVVEALRAGSFLQHAFDPLFGEAYLAVLDNTLADAQALGDTYDERYAQAV